MPRGLTLAVRPWLRDLGDRLSASGHTLTQRDLNGPFWRWCLRDDETDAFGRLLDLSAQSARFNRRLLREVSRIAAEHPVPSGRVDLRGIGLPEELLGDTRGLASWSARPATRGWATGFLERCGLLPIPYSLVTLGVGSLEELAVAAALSAAIRDSRPETHVTLALHQWENFSLARRIARLARHGVLLDLFDSAFVWREEVPEAAARLCDVLEGAPIERLVNTVTRVDGEPRIFASDPAEPSQAPRRELDTSDDASIEEYLDATGIPRRHIYLLDAIVRNDCYFGACTFCAQNSGYPRRQAYKVEPELDRAVHLVQHSSQRFGVRSFGFVDQAVPPKVLASFVERLGPASAEVRWTARMLFDADLPDDLLAAAASAGLKELLFGIETLSPPALAQIGKGATRASAEGLDALLGRLRRHGIDAALSFIWGLPAQSDADFQRTTRAAIEELARRHEHVTVISNAFELFDGTPMSEHPEEHGLVEVQAPAGDCTMSLAYTDARGRVGPRPLPSELSAMAQGPPFEGWPDDAWADLTRLDYSSFGLAYRWDTGRWMSRALRPVEGEREEGGPFPNRDELILGSNGYLGHNLASRIPAPALILSSRSPVTTSPVLAPYVAEDLTRGSTRLRRLRPRAVWLTARPVTEQVDEELTFLATLESVLHGWAESGSLERLVIFSTQLVAPTPAAGGAPVRGSTPPAPERPYELVKAQLELFAAYLARRFSIAADVVRLPLLFGGELSPRHRREQLLPRWVDALEAGARWRFDSPAAEQFGNSWVYVPDLVDALRSEAPNPGFRVRTARSGDFTYAVLQSLWPKLEQPVAELPLVRSSFYVADEFGLPERSLAPLRARPRAQSRAQCWTSKSNPVTSDRLEEAGAENFTE